MKTFTLFTLIIAALLAGCAGKRFDATSFTQFDLGRDTGVQFTKRAPDGTFTTVTIDQNESTGLGKTIGGLVSKAFSGNLDTALKSGASVLDNRNLRAARNQSAQIAGQNTVNKITAEAAAVP